MAETKTTTRKAAPKKEPVPAPETEEFGGYTLVHKGYGMYVIEGVVNKEFNSREEAVSHIADLEAVSAYEKEFGDLVPEGVEINHRTLMYSGTLIELPMNQRYLPEGAHSPYYDRAWVWGWGRATGTDIPMKEAKGYRCVTREELEEAVEEGKVPEHYRSLLMPTEHGKRMLFGDLALMRCPRILWRQRKAEKEKAALRKVQKVDEQNEAAFDKAGVKNVSGPIQNEVSTGLKISGFSD